VSDIKEKKLTKEIVLYVLFAFVLPLICVLLIKNFSIFQLGMPNFILYGIEAMTPTLSALLVTMLLGGRKGIKVFLRRLYASNIKIGYIVLAMIIPVAIFVATKSTLLLFDNNTPFFANISLRKLIIILWALIAEEVGWRGFLQEKFGVRFGYIATPLFVGSIWALWHYHFFWAGTMMSAPILLFALGCIAESYGYYWVTSKSKGNIIPASVWHFTGNLFISLFAISPEYNNGSTLPYLLYIGFTFIMAIIIVVREHNVSNTTPCLRAS